MSAMFTAEAIRRYRPWDLHCHLVGMSGTSPEQRMKELMAHADRMGIERVCLYLGKSLIQDPTPEQLREDNDYALRALQGWERRALGFVYVSPKHVRASLAELDRCIAVGPMVGVKLWVARRCHLPDVDPVIARAAELKALIFQHTWLKAGGNDPGESTPQDLVELAKRFPDVPLVCGHTGGDWEQGIRAIAPHKNIYADLAGSDPTAGFTEMAVRELGAERVLYGSDAAGRSFASQLAKVLGADIPEAAKHLILGGNLRRLLEPILKAKGMKVD
jgi:uncharacterized protein